MPAEVSSNRVAEEQKTIARSYVYLHSHVIFILVGWDRSKQRTKRV